MSRVLLGVQTTTNMPVELTSEQRQLPTYILGLPGTGKSTLLGHIALADMEAGEGLMLFDPHGDLAREILWRVPKSCHAKVVYINPEDIEQPVGINPFDLAPGSTILQATARANNFLEALSSVVEFAEIFTTAPRMRNHLLHLAQAFVANPGYTLVETPAFLSDRSFRQKFYPRVKEMFPFTYDHWQQFDATSPSTRHSQIESTLNKVERFAANPVLTGIFGQAIPRFRVDEAMEQGKIVVVNLAEAHIGRDNASLIGAMLIAEVLSTTLARTNRRPFHIIADEFQTFMSMAFPRLLTEGRKFGVDTVVAHQTRSQLTNLQTRGATLTAGNKILFALTGADAREMASEFQITIPDPVITGTRPKYGPSSTPLTEISRGGVGDPHINELYPRFIEYLDHYCDMLANYSRFPAGATVSTEPRWREVEQAREHVVSVVNQLLYSIMVNPPPRETLKDEQGEVFYETEYSFTLSERIRPSMKDACLWGVHRVAGNQSLYQKILLCYEQYEVHHETMLSIERLKQRYPRVYDDQDWKPALALYNRMGIMANPVVSIAERLGDSPINSVVGQEPIYDRPRLYSDVGGEIANNLVSQPPYQAWVKLGTQQMVITTPPLPPAENILISWATTTTLSKVIYGMPRAQVEAEIAARRVGIIGNDPDAGYDET